MATTTANVVCDNSTLAHFQSWVSALWNAWTTLGWVQTADTGQSANPPTAVGNVYQIFKANDTQAATTPIYVKVQCGTSSTNVQIIITVGSGSDGSGNITGSIMGPATITAGSSYANQGASTYNCYFSGDAGTFRMMMWQGGTAVNTVLGIERSRDSSGNKTTDYVTLLACNAYTSNGWYQQTMYTGSTTPTTAGSTINTSIPTTTGYYSVTGKVAAWPVIPAVGYPGNQMLGFVSAASGDVAESNGMTVTVNICGANHQYLFSEKSILVNIGRGTVGSYQGSIGMLYE